MGYSADALKKCSLSSLISSILVLFVSGELRPSVMPAFILGIPPGIMELVSIVGNKIGKNKSK